MRPDLGDQLGEEMISRLEIAQTLLSLGRELARTIQAGIDLAGQVEHLAHGLVTGAWDRSIGVLICGLAGRGRS